MSKLDTVDRLRAQQLGEHLMQELNSLPRESWHDVSFTFMRKADGGILIDGLTATAKEERKRG